MMMMMMMIMNVLSSSLRHTFGSHVVGQVRSDAAYISDRYE